MASIDGEDAGNGLSALFKALHNLKDVNNLARELLDELEQESPSLSNDESHFMY
jgi:hypothetical protein